MDCLKYIFMHTSNTVEINVDFPPSSLKYLHTSNADIVLSLNPEYQRMWVSVIYTGKCMFLDVTYSILRMSSHPYSKNYEVIGTETIAGVHQYDRLINPQFYQPRSNAKSAGK